MNTALTTILIQAACYGAAMVLPIFAIAFLQRGFFFKYFKVKSSLGRLILIKRRGQIRDYFKVGEIIEGFLIFNDEKDKKKFVNRICCDNTSYKAVYRSLGINWIDIDEDGRICTCNYAAVSGFDQKKYSDLYVTAEQQPQVGNDLSKIVIAGMLLLALLIIGAIYFGFQNYDKITYLIQEMPNLCKGVVTGGKL